MSSKKVKPLLDRTEVLNELWEYQNRNGFIRDVDVAEIADKLGVSKIELDGIISFYIMLLCI